MSGTTVLSTSDPDHEAVCAARSGDEAAFAILVRRHTRVIYTLALRTLGMELDAEDAVQEIFLKAYRGLDRFDSDRRFFPWLYSIAVNHLRSIRRRPAFRNRSETLPLSEELLPAPDTLEPEQQAMAAATRDLVTIALGRLRPIQRRVFLLRQTQGLSTAETSELLNLPENTIKTHLRRAREKVAEALTTGETSL